MKNALLLPHAVVEHAMNFLPHTRQLRIYTLKDAHTRDTTHIHIHTLYTHNHPRTHTHGDAEQPVALGHGKEVAFLPHIFIK